MRHKQFNELTINPILHSPRHKTYPGIVRLINVLVLAGLYLGLITILMDSQMLAEYTFTRVDHVYDLISPSPLYKLIKILEIFFIISAGILSYWTEGRFYANLCIKWIFAILLLWMTGHAIITFSGGFTNAELIGPKGPAVWWSLLILFAGFSRERWQRVIYPAVKIIVIIGAIEMAFRIFSLSMIFDRVDAQRTLSMSLRLMLWSAPLFFLVPKKIAVIKLLSVMLLSLISLAALMTATRSWLILCLIYLFAWIFCVFRKIKRPEQKITIVSLIVVILLPVVVLLMYSLFEPQITGGGNLLSSRIAIDSRTWQLEQFFRNVPFKDLMIGTGPRGTWRMGNRDYGWVDGVYFLLLFVGGIPLLTSYLYIVIYPAIRCLLIKGFSLYGSLEFACIFMGTMWAIVMTGLGTYTLPELKINHYIVLLCAGRCWSVLNTAYYNKNQFKRAYPLNPKSYYNFRRSNGKISNIFQKSIVKS